MPRYVRATRFFLEELYGPTDSHARDTQFKRVVPALVRLFPQEVVRTVHTLGELHALSEALDTEMGRVVPAGALDLASHARAWQRVGWPDDRQRQIQLTRRVAEALDVWHAQPVVAPQPAVDARSGAAGRAGRTAELPGKRLRHLRRDARGQGLLDTVVRREQGIAAWLFDPASLDGRAAELSFPPVPSDLRDRR